MISYATISKKGDREYNEDRTYISSVGKTACFVLADGLGGQGKGDVASTFVTDAIRNLYEKTDLKTRDDFINHAIETCQRGILDVKQKESIQEDMMSTAVILLVEKKKIIWGHVGDSRLYYFENNKMESHTKDHSVPQVLVSSGEITESEIRHHPDRNRLLRAIGMEEKSGRLNSLCEISRENRARQVFLLCSDGFWEHIDEKQMERTLRFAKSPEKWLEKMEKIVLKNGKDFNMDNYSAICVFVE